MLTDSTSRASPTTIITARPRSSHSNGLKSGMAAAPHSRLRSTKVRHQERDWTDYKQLASAFPSTLFDHSNGSAVRHGLLTFN